MDKLLKATRQGESQKVVDLGKEKLSENPDDVEAHFMMAMAYEDLEEYKLAIEYSSKCLSKLPNYFDCLVLNARCLSKLNQHDDAYEVARAALLENANPGYPGMAVKVFKLMSLIPGLKALRRLNEETINSHDRKTQWLKEYVDWYENK